MRFPPLPPSLLSLSPLSLLLLLVSAAAIPPTTSTDTSSPPPTGAELTPANFHPSIAQGLWFVEHFSPYCGHCKHFKPTWEQLVREGAQEMPGVRMGTVDCIMHGDLCDENGVKAYPTLFLFEDGKKVEEFKGSRDLDRLKTFLKRHIKEDSSPSPPSPPSTPAKSRPNPKPPSHPSHPSHPPLNPSGLVLPLTTSSFAPTLARGPTFIKFFAPWCGHCKKLAPTWRNLAKHMQGRVTIAEVNCDEESSLCKEQGVQGYPTLMWYPGGAAGEGGKGRSEYSSGRRLEQLKAFVEKASAGGVQKLEKDEDLEKQVAEDDVVYLLLHSPSDTEILDTIREASAPLLGSPQILASSSPALFSKYSIPSIPSSSSSYTLLALKDHDATTPVSLFHSSLSPSSPSSPSSSSNAQLQQWLLTHRLPTTLELTQDTFQGVMNAPQKPLVVIFAAPETLKDKVMQRLRDVGSKWKVRTQTKDGAKGGESKAKGEGKGEIGETHGRQVVFAWMDSGRWGEWMKNMYGIVAPSGAEGEGEGKAEGGSLEDVKVVIADHSRLIYYDTDHLQNPLKATSSASIFAALDDAASGLSAYKHSEGPIERVARYLNTKLTSLEEFITTSPLKALGLFALVLVVVFWVLNRAIGNEVVVVGGKEEAQRGWSKQKGRNGRLD